MIKHFRRHFFGEFTPNKGGELFVVWTRLLSHLTEFLDALMKSRDTQALESC